MSTHDLQDKMQKMRMQQQKIDYVVPKASTSMYPPTSSSSRTSNGTPSHGQGGGLYHSGIPVGQRGSNTNLYAQERITSPHRTGGMTYLPQRGSSQDLYQLCGSAAGTPSSGGGGRDLIAAAAAASQKNRQTRGRPGSGSPLASHPFNEVAYYKSTDAAAMLRKNLSWNSVDSLEHHARPMHYEDPTSTIRLPRSTSQPQAPVSSSPHPPNLVHVASGTFQSTQFMEQMNFDDLDEDDSSSIGYMDDYEQQQGVSITTGFMGGQRDVSSRNVQAAPTLSTLPAPAPYLFAPPPRSTPSYADDRRVPVSPPKDMVRQDQLHHGNVTGPYMATALYSPPQYQVPMPHRYPPRSAIPTSPSSYKPYHTKPSSSPPVPGPSVQAPSTTTPASSGRKPQLHHAHSENAKYEYSAAGTRQEGDISIWIGTWNLGAADPFSDSRGLMDDADTSRMVRHLVPVGYDLYVLGVQEGVNENVYFAIQAYLNRNPQLLRYQRKELRNDKVVLPNKQAPVDAVFDAVRGRGDGAFMGTKFTGMAVFCGEHVSADVQVLRAGLHKFNIASGSKGGVAVALKVKHTTLCFINCHLDARNDTYRREQIRLLNTNLGKVMGHPYFDLTQQFHHIVWMGDLNYRIVKMDASEVCRLLSEDRIEELHERGDGLLNDRKQGIFEGFKEPDKFHNFYPTYKKFPLRGNVDMHDPNWPERVYRVLYKEPFYKGGQVKKRVPGWCDRILVYSTPMRNSDLVAEKVPCPFMQGRWVDNYQSINDGVGMDVSDHSPVTCTMLLKFVRPSMAGIRGDKGLSLPGVPDGVSSYTDLRPNVRLQGPSYGGGPHGPITTVLTLFNMVVTWGSHSHVPKKTRVVAPLMGEDDLNRQTEATGERNISITNVATLSLNVKLHHERSLQDLHMLVWVRHESVVGHCVVSLKRVADLHIDGTDEARYKASLYFNASPVTMDGVPVKLIFSVKPSNLHGIKIMH
ncbi:hypothetical protein, variant [Aphanomyces invadans]|uniref:Inositol polyphosphate-related phosphatase domain-containing protein n=1 Tax=Aphanomyces invadans TaxID=157072 RepID=A0A024TL71_9STRA|nr:hypothetical protein, variant [Aphanomyces invadans]ETV94097.1 hypothetical protein, variant [Aphanomyces invadans]|eukprot:XP_008877299.1 hypothetical protein, variant [Aphanomyces invadans]